MPAGHIEQGESADRAALIETYNFRLAVDRVFVKKGAGVIVTGTIFSGAIRQGDRVVIAGSDRKLRVRGVHVQNSEAYIGVAGQRCAINLAGVELNKQKIRRGNWVTCPEVIEPVCRFDAELRLLTVARPLKHWTPVHLHHAASEATARIAVLEGSSIKPGESALVQIVSDKPLAAVFGDLFIVRDQSARHTLGGGRVIDIFAPRRGRAKPDRIRFLQHSDNHDAKDVLRKLVENGEGTVDFNHFVANRNLKPQVATELFACFDKHRSDQQRKNTAVSNPLPGVESNAYWPNLAKALDREGIRGILISELADAVGVSPDQCSFLLTSGVRQGLVVKLSHKLLMLPQYLIEIKNILTRLTEQNNNTGFSINDFREATGLSRNRAVEILESLDRQGITRRDGQPRRLLANAQRRIDQLLKQVE